MAVYENRLLFRQVKNSESGMIALESVWAYNVQLGDSHPIPGRYRVRIANVEMVEADGLTHIGSTLMCLCEKWTNEGWIECLEYMPKTSMEDFYTIESEINNMFKSFTTGVGLETDFYSSDPFKPPKKKTPDEPEKETPPPQKKSEDIPDFDWI